MLVQTNTAKKASFNQFSTNITGNNNPNTNPNDPNKKPVQDEKTPVKEQPDQKEQSDKKDTEAK